MELYNHQKVIINEDPKRVPLALGTGTGKTRTCLELAEGRTLVIALKQGRDDKTWEMNAEKFGIVINMKVISKEDFRRDHKKLPPCDTFIFDEAHCALGVSATTNIKNGQEIINNSQLFQATEWYLAKHNPKRVYFASATMIPLPMKLWALARLFGKKWDFFSFRRDFYVARQKGWKTTWIKKKGKKDKERLIELFKKNLGAYTGRLQDFVDVPEQTHQTKYVDLTTSQKKAIADAKEFISEEATLRAKIRQIENGIQYTYELDSTGKVDKMIKSIEKYPNNKLDYILERAEEFPKMMIFADYTSQVYDIVDTLKKAGYNAIARTAKTENPDVFKQADNMEEVIVVVQARISAGYEFKTCPCVIFASKSNAYIDYEQGIGRVLRADHLKKNLYIHLVVKGGLDEKCHLNIMDGEDFQEMLMEK